MATTGNTTGDETCVTGVLTGETISSSRRQANRQGKQNATTGVLTGESIHQQRGSPWPYACV